METMITMRLRKAGGFGAGYSVKHPRRIHKYHHQLSMAEIRWFQPGFAINNNAEQQISGIRR
jgi:hypothetical protein